MELAVLEVQPNVDYSFRCRRSRMALEKAKTEITYGRHEKALEHLRVIQLICEDQTVIKHATTAIHETTKLIHGEMV